MVKQEKGINEIFLVIARASAFETGALVDFLASENDIHPEAASSLSKEIENISKMLYSIIKSLE